MSEGHALLFAIIVWATVVALLFLVVRLIGCRPFWTRRTDRYQRAPHF
jgi:hypothetical protein